MWLARALSIVGHPALLMPAAVAQRASRAGVPPDLLPAALATALVVALTVGIFSVVQVRAGRWTHVDASQPRERSQLNVFLVALLLALAVLLWAVGQRPSLALGPLVVALPVLLGLALRKRLKLSLHTTFAVFAAALVWPHPWWTPAVLALAAGVAWSRLALRRHTLPEVLLGLLVGAALGVAFRAGVG
jgi:membrane-associated phospholipid phosphatase